MKAVDAETLGAMVRRLVAEFQPEQIILFGSRAWGQPDDGSDVDLFVIVPDSDERPIQRSHRAHRCLGDTGIAKDILVRTRAEVEKYRHVRASLEAEILERGRVLYG